MSAKHLFQWSSLLAVVMFLGYPSFFTHAKSADVVNITETQITFEKKINTETLLQALMLDKGVGSFSQNKYFKFLAVPIRSTGNFIVKQQAVLWQTQLPVFSEILIQPNGIYRRLTPKTKYEQLVDNSEFSLLLATIFTGEINSMQWQIGEEVSLVEDVDLTGRNYCLSLKPKAKQLQQLFQHVDLCLAQLPPERRLSDSQSYFDLSKRHINLFDPQGNKSQISMKINARALTTAQRQALIIAPSNVWSDGKINNKQAHVDAR